jgi:PDZ domain-containing secreted protein
MTTLGIKGDDHILAINGTDYNLDNIYDLIMSSESWKDGDEMTVKIRRAGKEQVLKGKVVLPKEEKDGFIAVDKSKEALKNAWLKG